MATTSRILAHAPATRNIRRRGVPELRVAVYQFYFSRHSGQTQMIDFSVAGIWLALEERDLAKNYK